MESNNLSQADAESSDMLRQRLVQLHLRGTLSALESEYAMLVSQQSQYPEMKAALGCVLVRATSDGHVGLTRAVICQHELMGQLEQELSLQETTLEAALEESWNGLAVFDLQRLYLQRSWSYEVRVSEWVAERLTGEVVNGPGFDDEQLDQAQQQAVWQSLQRRFSLITGGPGTGKTTVIAALVRQLLAQGQPAEAICVAAPTGKAVARLGSALQSLLPDSCCLTVHRLLGWQEAKNRFRHGRNHPLSHSTVIIDEASMMDLELIFHLIVALPQDCRLILVGDRAQLASVAAGHVFSELCDALTGHPAMNELRRNYRFQTDSPLGQLSAAIRVGDEQAVMDLLAQRHPQLVWLKPDEAADLTRWFEHVVPQQFLRLASAATPSEAIQAAGSFRILCIHRHGPGSTSLINRAFQQWLSHRFGGDLQWRLMIATRNDYRLSVFNGDSLIDAAQTSESGLWVEDVVDGARKLSTDTLPGMQPAYAITTHKSQGSEFDEVAVVLAPEHSALLTREALYTAVTRAKRKVVLVASGDAISTSLRSVTLRHSGLAQRLTTVISSG